MFNDYDAAEYGAQLQFLSSRDCAVAEIALAACRWIQENQGRTVRSHAEALSLVLARLMENPR